MSSVKYIVRCNSTAHVHKCLRILKDRSKWWPIRTLFSAAKRTVTFENGYEFFFAVDEKDYIGRHGYQKADWDHVMKLVNSIDDLFYEWKGIKNGEDK